MNTFLAKIFFLVWVTPVENFLANGAMRVTDHFCSLEPWFWKPRKQNQRLLFSHELSPARKSLLVLPCVFITLALRGRYYDYTCLTGTDTMSNFLALVQGHIANKGLALDHKATCHDPTTPLCPDATHPGLPWALKFFHIHATLLADP